MCLLMSLNTYLIGQCLHACRLVCVAHRRAGLFELGQFFGDSFSFSSMLWRCVQTQLCEVMWTLFIERHMSAVEPTSFRTSHLSGSAVHSASIEWLVTERFRGEQRRLLGLLVRVLFGQLAEGHWR